METPGAGHSLPLRRSIRIRNRTPINHDRQSTLASTEFSENVSDTIADERNNPLQNPLILNHVFSFLDLGDIKQCRLVCKKWNDLAISVQDKTSAIKIQGFKFVGNSPNNFNEFWEDSGRNFRAFKLEPFPHHRTSWPVKTLVGFLKDQKQMQELTINNINVIGYRKEENYFDISPYISEDFTHLAMDNTNGSQFIVSTDKLTTVKSLSLTQCRLNMAKESKLTLESFKLNDVAIIKNGGQINEVVVNDLMDFESLKEMTLECAEHLFEPYGSMLAVDMSGKTTLSTLSLNRIKIRNFKESQWQINGKFKLRNIPYTEPTQIKFTEMDFGNETIHLDALPASIEKLILFVEAHPPWNWNVYTTIIGSPFLNLPNLNYLELLTDCRANENQENDENRNPFASLPLFRACQNLTTVKLVVRKIHYDEHYAESLFQDLTSDWIPPTTKNLFLTGNIDVGEGENVELEKLVIEDNHLDNIIDTVRRLKSNHLVLDLNAKFLPWTESLERIILALIEMPYDTLAIGSLGITKAAFRKSSFTKCVDQRAEYYMFRNQKGKSIMEWEFRRMTKTE